VSKSPERVAVGYCDEWIALVLFLVWLGVACVFGHLAIPILILAAGGSRLGGSCGGAHRVDMAICMVANGQYRFSGFGFLASGEQLAD
jgi:hypothetical protein